MTSYRRIPLVDGVSGWEIKYNRNQNRAERKMKGPVEGRRNCTKLN
jgi:hypothetical protein